MKEISLLTSHKHKLVYVIQLKVGSRTMFKVMFAMAGIPETPDKLWGQDFAKRVDELAEYGLVKERYSLDDAIEFQKQHMDYTWFAITRNPYKRALSSYSNKANRVFRYTHRRAYILSKLKTLLSHPKNWWSIYLSRKYLQ